MKKYLALIILPLLVGCNMNEKVLGLTDTQVISSPDLELKTMELGFVPQVIMFDTDYYLVDKQEVINFVDDLNFKNKTLGLANTGELNSDCDNMAKLIDASADLLNARNLEPAMGVLIVSNVEKQIAHLVNIVFLSSGDFLILDVRQVRSELGNASYIENKVVIMDFNSFMDEYNWAIEGIIF